MKILLYTLCAPLVHVIIGQIIYLLCNEKDPEMQKYIANGALILAGIITFILWLIAIIFFR